jgi:tetratricopeptide (TPR) repeat protein
LLTQLAKVAALKVISRTSVMGYAATTKTLTQIAAELGVGTVVEGSVQAVNGRLRVNVQLIDAATDQHLWAERYDRTLDDAFAVQSEIAQRIVGAVGATLTNREQGNLSTAPTASPEAYLLYLQGRSCFLRAGYSQQNFTMAQRLFERSLALDSGFALAHAALARVHGNMFWFRFDPSPARAARQRAEAEEALRLAPDLPEAHFAMGAAHYVGRRDWRGALAEYTIAAQGLPNDAELREQIGYTYRHMGQWTEVFAAYNEATRLDPLNVTVICDLGGNTHVFCRKYADAVRAYDRALSLAPDLRDAAVGRAWTFVRWQGRLGPLRETLAGMPEDTGLAKLGKAANERAELLLFERNADGLLQMLEAQRVTAFEGQYYFLPAPIYAAWAYQMRGDRVAARAAFEAGRVRLGAALRELPEDWRMHAAHGLALAGLERRVEALSEAGWMQRSEVYLGDALQGTVVAEYRAKVLAQAGDADAALDEIERLLAGPSRLSVHILRLDPRWDPIRDHPRFKALLAKHSVSDTR